MTVDLSKSPTHPDPDWMSSFTRCVRRNEPACTPEHAREQAMMAYASTWLLDGREAFELWNAAVRNCSPMRLQPNG